MESNELRNKLYDYQKEIAYYSQMQTFSTNPYEKNYYQGLIQNSTENLAAELEDAMLFAVGMEAGTDGDRQPLHEMQNLPAANSPEGAPTAEETPEEATLATETPPREIPAEGPPEGEAPEGGQQEQMPQEPLNTERVFTVSELSEYNGTQGKPAYVAVNGKVYDVSDKAAWAGGTHFAGLRAGNDLTGQFMSCHRGMGAMLEQLPVVGVMETAVE